MPKLQQLKFSIRDQSQLSAQLLNGNTLGSFASFWPDTDQKMSQVAFNGVFQQFLLLSGLSFDYTLYITPV